MAPKLNELILKGFTYPRGIFRELMFLVDEAANVGAEKCEDVILSASMPYLNRQMGDTVMAAVIMLIITPLMLDMIDNRARSMAKA